MWFHLAVVSLGGVFSDYHVGDAGENGPKARASIPRYLSIYQALP